MAKTFTEFRRAQLSDLVAVAQMLRRFYQKHGQAYGIPYDHASTIGTALQVVTRGICLVGDRCCAGAVPCPFPFNNNYIIAQVVFWYFEHRRDITIFDALMREMRKAGVTHINAAALPPGTTGKRFYQARGMTLVETHFMGPVTENPCRTAAKG